MTTNNENKTWDQVDKDVLDGIRSVNRQLGEMNQTEMLDKLKYAERAYCSLSDKVRSQVVNDHAADMYRRMMAEFQSNDVLMSMFTDLLSTAKLYNAEFVNDLMAIDKKYGINNE